MTRCKRCLHIMNLCSYPYAPNVMEHIATTIGPQFDPSSEPTLAFTFIFILYIVMCKIPGILYQINCVFCTLEFLLESLL